MSGSQIQRRSSKSTSLKARKVFKNNVEKFSSLYKISLNLYRVYCNLTGPFHICPDFYIIGAAKSGTSALYDYLIQHPVIHTATTKEPRFFDKYYNRGTNWYRVLFPLQLYKTIMIKLLKKKFLTGEATPRYLDHPHAASRIKQLTPNAKFIVLLRNPVNRIFSHYNMRHNSGKEPLSFTDAINSESERTNGEFERMQKDENYYSFDYYHHSYLDRSIYVDKLKHWMSVFPKEQFLIIQSESFFSNPDLVYQDVLKFLDVDGYHLDEYFKIDAGKYKKEKMESDIRKYLVEYFKPHNERLFSFLGKRFDWN